MNNGGPLSSGSFLFIYICTNVKLHFTWFIPAISWFILATVLLVLPGPDIPKISFLDGIYFDKWVHAGLFGGLSFLLSYPFIKIFKATKKMLIYIAILCALYGASLEYVQKYFAIQRDFDYMDMLADAAGCILSYITCVIVNRKHFIKYSQKNKPL